MPSRPCPAISPAAMPIPTARPSASPSASRCASIPAPRPTNSPSIWRRRTMPARRPICRRRRPSPPKTVDLAKLAPLKVRSGAYQNFTRIVFDWPRNVPYTVFPGAGKLTVRFEAQANPDFSAISRQAPPWVKTAGWHIESKGIIVELATDMASGLPRFPRRDACRRRRAGAEDRRRRLQSAGSRQADRHRDCPAGGASAVATGAPAKLAANAPKPAVAAKPAAAPAAQPAAQTRPANPAAAAPAAATPLPRHLRRRRRPMRPAPPVQDCRQQTDRRRRRADLPGAGRRAAAVFTRGLTAWIVLENAPPLDVAKLKSQLGTFPLRSMRRRTTRSPGFASPSSSPKASRRRPKARP